MLPSLLSFCFPRTSFHVFLLVPLHCIFQKVCHRHWLPLFSLSLSASSYHSSSLSPPPRFIVATFSHINGYTKKTENVILPLICLLPCIRLTLWILFHCLRPLLALFYYELRVTVKIFIYYFRGRHRGRAVIILFWRGKWNQWGRRGHEKKRVSHFGEWML